MTSTKPHLRSLVTSDGAVILDANQNIVFSINSTGGYIWGRLQEDTPTEVVIHELAQQTGVDVATIERDVQEFLDDLFARHLINPHH